MELQQKIYQDYLAAFRARDKAKADFLSFIRAELKNRSIDLKRENLNDAEVIKILNKYKKRLEETIEQAQRSQRHDFIAQVKKEIDILNGYLPQSPSLEVVKNVVDEVIKDLNAISLNDMGKVMKEVLFRIGTNVDAKEVSTIVKESLSSLSSS